MLFDFGAGVLLSPAYVDAQRLLTMYRVNEDIAGMCNGDVFMSRCITCFSRL